MKRRTKKDIMVSLFLNDKRSVVGLDPDARIAPAIFFQPHFGCIEYEARLDEQNRAILRAEQYEYIRQSPAFQNFKYIKAFTPMRRPTTSYGAGVRYAVDAKTEVNAEGIPAVVNDMVFERILNRGYLRDPEDRLFQDSILVRFEDGKLNPKATFTALAAFLDLPYTESITYCSQFGERDFHTEGNVDGFDPATVYRTYDDYTNDAERTLIEYFARDAYEQYGYSFHYYDGALMDEARVRELIDGCTTIDGFMRKTYRNALRASELLDNPDISEEDLEAVVEDKLRSEMERTHEKRIETARTLMRGLRFVNLTGQPLQYMKQLELDPALLERPLYH